MRLLEREEPSALLAAACRSAARGRGGVVLVTGEAGIGKTSLVADLCARPCGGRVLVGACDDLATPRPLAPLRDLVGQVPTGLAAAITGGARRAELHDRLLEALAEPPAPTVLVLEDVHWADDATADVITTVGRRVAALPALLVLTLRDGEVGDDHPVRRALASLPARTVTRIRLAPLSRSAVAAIGGPDDADRIHALTGGNPFYVTELVRAGGAGAPASVRDAVRGRLAALSPATRELVELLSIVPSRLPTTVVDAVQPGWMEAAESAERHGVLQVGPRSVGFRHELARRAVEAELPGAARRRLHGQVLAALRPLRAEPADLVHHAEGAGDDEALAACVLPAARQAAALQANRQAYAHYRRAARVSGRLPEVDRPHVFEELARAAYLVGRTTEALDAVDVAVAAHHRSGDVTALARCTRLRSRLRWHAGDGAAARADARAVVDLLEGRDEPAELARACSTLSQLAVLGDRHEEALRWGRRAIRTAQELGDRATEAHALVNVGTVLAMADPAQVGVLEEAHRLADDAGEAHEAVRALVNEAWAQLLGVRPGPARAAAERASAYAAAHEVDTLSSYLAVTLAWLDLREGRWADAERTAIAGAGGGASVGQLLAAGVLGELAVRRGDADAADRLRAVAEQARRTGELQRIGPVLEVQIEAALLTDAPMPVEDVRLAADLAREAGHRGWGGARLAAWASIAGVELPVGGQPVAEPYAAVLAGDRAAAAEAFGRVGWHYDRALLLSLLDDRASLGEALALARALGAGPLAARVTRRMRARGLLVPRGPGAATRSHPAGLTPRQLEVLALLAEGLTNAEIAERLVVSPRTAEHHVTALLTKLGAPTRRAAVRRAGALGVLPPRWPVSS